MANCHRASSSASMVQTPLSLDTCVHAISGPLILMGSKVVSDQGLTARTRPGGGVAVIWVSAGALMEASAPLGSQGSRGQVVDHGDRRSFVGFRGAAASP